MTSRAKPAEWARPEHWAAVTTIEAHAGGEPLRVITGGLPKIPGDTILAKRRWAMKNLDYLRTALMWEPRGHADMYGAILTEPTTPDGDLGVLFLHNEGFSTMCGHGVIALAKVVLDTGIIEMAGDDPVIRMDTPAGRITATAHRSDGFVESVSFLNVPSFVYLAEQCIDVPGLGNVHYDLAFGGAFYAFCSAEELGVELQGKNHGRLVDLGRRIKQAVAENTEIKHPFEADLGFLYGTILVGPADDPAHHSRNVCIFAEGEVDRSPTGTGVSARAAIHHFRGELPVGKGITIESILGTCMDVEVAQRVAFGGYDAVIPRVAGKAWIVGRCEFFIDPSDPLRDGFIFR